MTIYDLGGDLLLAAAAAEDVLLGQDVCDMFPPRTTNRKGREPQAGDLSQSCSLSELQQLRPHGREGEREAGALLEYIMLDYIIYVACYMIRHINKCISLYIYIYIYTYIYIHIHIYIYITITITITITISV